MRIRKYHKSSTIVLIIVIFALLAVASLIVFIYNKGVRYIKTDAGIKYFGFLSDDGMPSNGRFWYGDGTVVSVKEQKFIAVEFPPSENADTLSESMTYDKLIIPEDTFFLDDINSEGYDASPLNHFLFDNSGNIQLVKENFIPYFKYLESNGSYITELLLTDRNAKEWEISSVKGVPSSYADYEIVDAGGSGAKYNGDILTFLTKEKIIFGTMKFKNGTIINLYGCENIVRLFYEDGLGKGDVYIGKIDGGLYKSGGIHFYEKTGDIYYGDFTKDEKTGECMIRTSNGDYYSGSVVKGSREGTGKAIWNDGSSYEGGFENGMKNGKGIYIFTDGTVYEGDFVNDCAEGYGIMRFAGGDIYEGDFEGDYYSGRGIYRWATGDVYEGDFKNGIINGEGTFTWVSGRTYTGYFTDGKMTYSRPEE